MKLRPAVISRARVRYDALRKFGDEVKPFMRLGLLRGVVSRLVGAGFRVVYARLSTTAARANRG